MSVYYYYYLNETTKKVYPCKTREDWHVSNEQIGKVVAKHCFAQKNIIVSTVFTGIDLGNEKLFETMIFRRGQNVHCERYSTWEAAKKGHNEIVLNNHFY